MPGQNLLPRNLMPGQKLTPEIPNARARTSVPTFIRKLPTFVSVDSKYNKSSREGATYLFLGGYVWRMTQNCDP